MYEVTKELLKDIAELGSITIWYRPEHAISWDGIKNSLPDVQAFIKDVKDYISTISFSSLWQKVKNLSADSGSHP